jgi:hypothetical protein
MRKMQGGHDEAHQCFMCGVWCSQEAFLMMVAGRGWSELSRQVSGVGVNGRCRLAFPQELVMVAELWLCEHLSVPPCCM